MQKNFQERLPGEVKPLLEHFIIVIWPIQSVWKNVTLTQLHCLIYVLHILGMISQVY